MQRLLICLFFVFATPAFADMTGVYQSPAGAIKMTIEIAANGDIRGDFPGEPSVYTLTRNGQDYYVIATSHGFLVDRVEDEAAAVRIVSEKRMPGFSTSMKDMGPNLAAMQLTCVSGDDIIIHGRKGTPYYIGHGGPGTPSHVSGNPGVPPIVVVSSDPELAPLGVAWAHSLQVMDSLMPGNPVSRELDTVLKTGAPLALVGVELTTISHDPIPSSRFELPAAPESREDIIKRIDATATDKRVTAF